MRDFFRMNFNYFLKVVKKNIFKLKIKDKGFSRFKVFMFYLDYIDRFMPSQNKNIVNSKLSMIFMIIRRLVISNIAHNIKNYSGIELNFKRWSDWISVVDLANQLSYSKKAKNQIVKKSIKILILDSFYGRGKEDRDIALENINKIIKLLELPETSKDIEDFILNCALYIFSFTNELPIVPNIDDNLFISQLELLERITIMLGFPSKSYSFRKKIALKSLECINSIETLDELSIRRAFFASIETLDFEMSKPFAFLMDMSMPNFDISEEEPDGGSHESFAGRDLLEQMKLREIESKVFIITQLDTFGESVNKLSLTELKKQMKEEFSPIYRDAIYYNKAQENWKTELKDKIGKLDD